MKTIQERGKTKVGDKTILDTLSFILENLKKTNDDLNYSEIFKKSTKEALQAFEGKKILIGRARMFEDKTKELDDPGMFALYKLSEAF
jgi:dihydroxyacetone kinase-like protein